MRKLLLLSAVGFMLAGCKVDLQTKVNISDIFSENAKKIDARLVVDVASCTDYNDSRKESDSVLKAKQTISTIFSNAKYLECHTEKMQSKAQFSVPISVGSKESTDSLNIVGSKGMIKVTIPQLLADKIKAARRNTMIQIDPRISIVLTNDTATNKQYYFYSVFIDGEGFAFIKADLPAKSTGTFMLSDASMSQLLRDKLTFFVTES